ncbi:unnamed protein product [Closterium sp. NIES-53]
MKLTSSFMIRFHTLSDGGGASVAGARGAEAGSAAESGGARASRVGCAGGTGGAGDACAGGTGAASAGGTGAACDGGAGAGGAGAGGIGASSAGGAAGSRGAGAGGAGAAGAGGTGAAGARGDGGAGGAGATGAGRVGAGAAGAADGTGTHVMELRPSSVPQRVALPSPPASSLAGVPSPESDIARAANPIVSRLLDTVVTDPDFDSTAAFALLTELVDFAARSHLDYVASFVTESESICPPSVGGELALVEEKRPRPCLGEVCRAFRSTTVFVSLSSATMGTFIWVQQPLGL